MIKMRLINC